VSDLIDLAGKPDEATVTDDGNTSSRVDDRNRYKIPDPDTGKPARWTRATNFAKSIQETDNLQRWAERMVVKGLGERPDLVAQAAKLTVEDRNALEHVAKEAKSAAGAWKRAGYGIALHSMTERVDRGDLDPAKAGPPWGSLLRAYVDVLRKSQVEILPQYVERTVVVKKYKVAGTFDRIVRMPSGELWIADLKTGRDLKWSWGEIAIQLALYANADAMYDFETGQFADMPKVNQEQALVIHLPVEGTVAAVYRINIAHGWKGAELCERARNYRRFNGFAEEAVSVKVEDDAPDLPREWVARIAAATTVKDLSRIWSEANAKDEWTEALEDLGHQRGAEIRGSS